MVIRRIPVVLILSAIVGVGATRAAAEPILNFGVSSQGCFGVGCSAFASTADGGGASTIWFTGMTYGNLDLSSLTSFSLGTLTRDNTRALPDTTFVLQVLFGITDGVSEPPLDIFADVSANNTQGSPNVFDFDNALRHLAFANALGSGSFDFWVSNDPTVTKNSSQDILGNIANFAFTPASFDPPPIDPPSIDPPSPDILPVPEPATIVLVGIGLGGGWLGRRRLARK